MSPFGSPPRLRLALIFFTEEDMVIARELVRTMHSELLPWVVVERPPFEAVLFGRGPRAADPDELAIMRLSSDAERFARRSYGDAMPPIAMRKPLQPAHLKMVLEMGAASLIPEHIARLSPQTRPRISAFPYNTRPLVVR
ncbi:MAG TPA: hypothetical protein VMG60_09690 [Burkholderiaceae bacterium]|nr:hypothetical protein [Burkholderiaceae bacterium]